MQQNKIVFKTQQLKDALAFCSRAIKKNSVLPILLGCKIETNGNLILVTATDLETCAIKAIKAISVEKQTSFVIEDRAMAFISKMAGAEITFVISEEKGVKKLFDTANGETVAYMPVCVEITCDKNKGKFMLDRSDDFPITPELESNDTFNISPDVLKAVNKAIKYCSTDDLRPALTGISNRPDKSLRIPQRNHLGKQAILRD